MSDLDLTTMENHEVEKSLQNDREISKWCLQTLVSEYRKHDFKTLGYEEGVMTVVSEERKKPSKPFKVEDVLKYTFRGEKTNKSTSDDVTVIN